MQSRIEQMAAGAARYRMQIFASLINSLQRLGSALCVLRHAQDEVLS
jgi:hypothetical protein